MLNIDSYVSPLVGVENAILWASIIMTFQIVMYLR